MITAMITIIYDVYTYIYYAYMYVQFNIKVTILVIYNS